MEAAQHIGHELISILSNYFTLRSGPHPSLKNRTLMWLSKELTCTTARQARIELD